MTEPLAMLRARRHLSADQARALCVDIAQGRVPDDQAAEALSLLRDKGEDAAEVLGFARALLELAHVPSLPTPGASGFLDIVGTGGDGSGSVNLSTGAAILAAACGAHVVKHGNRAVSSRCGSADVLEALGVAIPGSDASAAASLARANFAFLFAPRWHPAFARIAPIRKRLGGRSIFNLLGPLINPVRPRFGVLGTYSPDAARLYARVLADMHADRFFVIHGDNGWDEPTPACPFRRWRVQRGHVTEDRLDPRELGVSPCTEHQLAGGDAAHNAGLLRAALTDSPGPIREALVLGAGLALEAANLATDPAAGVALARRAIDDGRAARCLSALPEARP